MRYILIMLLIFFIGCSGMQTTKSSDYEAWLSTCKDYKDVSAWLDKNFTYDKERLQVRKQRMSAPLYPPEYTFYKKSGVCSDAAIFTKDALTKLGYKAEVVFLDSPARIDHFVTAFWLEDGMYIMDYATLTPACRSTWGPFEGLDDYVKNIYTVCSRHKKLDMWYFGFPAGYRK